MSIAREHLVTGGLAVLASLAVTGTVYAFTLGQPRLFVVAPLALLLGVALLALALARFEVFVLAILVSRTSLDALKLGGTGAFPEPSALLGMLFSGVSVVWLLSEVRRTHQPFSRLSWAALIFVGVAFLGVLTSPQPGSSIVEWSRLTSMLLMLLVVERLAGRPAWRRQLAAAVALAVVVPLCAATVQLVTNTNLFSAGGFERIRGTFVHSNPLAAFLTLVTVLALAVLLNDRDHRHRVLAWIVLLPSLTGLLLTYTRAGWLAAVVGSFLVAAVFGRRALLPMIATAVLVVLLIPGVGQRFADLTEGETPRGEPSNSLSWRVGYWKSALDLTSDAPISGLGLKQIAAQQEESKQPHNDFVRAYVELGPAGLASYLYLVWQYGATAVAAVRRSRLLPPGLDRALLVGFAGVAVSYTLMGVVMNLFTQVVVGLYFYATAGVAVAILRTCRPPGAHRATTPAPTPTHEPTGRTS